MKYKLVTGLKYISPATIARHREQRFCSEKAAQKYIDTKIDANMHNPDAFSIMKVRPNEV